MKKHALKNLFIAFLILGAISCKNTNQKPNKNDRLIDIGLNDVQDWFNAWEMTSENLLKIEKFDLPTMVFFDNEFLYTNSNKYVINASKIEGPSFFGKKLNWTKRKHYDTIQLPSGQKLPIAPLSFAVPIENENEKSFFVMALPSVWRSAKIESQQLGNSNFYTAVFLHEFAHSQQTKNFGKQLETFAKNWNFQSNLNDDMIQKDFNKDSLYTINLKKEIEIFYKAYIADDKAQFVKLTKRGLSMYKIRQEKYFDGEKKAYQELDDFFLTMEGIGQYVSFLWLTSNNGAKLTEQTAINGLRRKKDNWAQEESLALFLIYSRMNNLNLGKEMFNDKIFYITDLIEKQLE